MLLTHNKVIKNIQMNTIKHKIMRITSQMKLLYLAFKDKNL